MNENKPKAVAKLIVAALLLITGIFCFVWISAPDISVTEVAANKIAQTDDAVIDDFKLLGKMGTKQVDNEEYTYYIIIAHDKSGTEYTMAMAVNSEIAAEFDNIYKSADTAQTISDKFFGSITAMGDETSSTYASLLEEYGYDSTYPNLYYVFTDSGISSNPNAGLGFICLLPFVGFAAFFAVSFFKSQGSKE